MSTEQSKLWALLYAENTPCVHSLWPTKKQAEKALKDSGHDSHYLVMIGFPAPDWMRNDPPKFKSRQEELEFTCDEVWEIKLAAGNSLSDPDWVASWSDNPEALDSGMSKIDGLFHHLSDLPKGKS